MNVLVTGGTGYIGSHICVELLEAGHEVIVIDDFSNSKPEVLGYIKDITGKEVKFYEFNILDEAKIDYEIYDKIKANPTIIIIAMGKLFVSQNLDTIMQQIHIIKYSVPYIIKRVTYSQ